MNDQPETEKGHPSRGRRPDRGRRFVWCVVLLLAGGGLAELAVRLFDLGPPTYRQRVFTPNGGVPFTRLDNGLVVYQPNTTFASVYDPAGDDRGYFRNAGNVTYRLNSLGMRGPEIASARSRRTVRIVCLGDSITFGEGVYEEDTYPSVLREELSEKMRDRTVEVINAGVQGYGTQEALAFYLLRCQRFKPDVVTLGFFLNDATPFNETLRQNEARTTDWALSGPARLSRIWEIFERRNHARRLQHAFFETTRRSFESQQWADCVEALAGMEQVSREDGFRFVVVVFPILWQLDGDYPFLDIHQEIARACRKAGCEWIDLLPVYRGHPAESLWVHPTDQHPNEIAQRLAARRIADYLTRETPRNTE